MRHRIKREEKRSVLAKANALRKPHALALFQRSRPRRPPRIGLSMRGEQQLGRERCIARCSGAQKLTDTLRCRVLRLAHRAEHHDLDAGALKNLDQAGAVLRHKCIVGIDRADDAPPRRIEPRVARGGRTGVLLRDHANAGIATSNALKHRSRAVRRAVVHADKLKVAHGLRKHRLDALPHRGRRVVHGHDERYRWSAPFRRPTHGPTCSWHTQAEAPARRA